MLFSSISPTATHQALGWAVILLLLCSPAQAQSNGDGSIYSRFGLGTLTNFSSSQAQAMGGGAYAVRSLNYNPSGNPALWSDQVFTRFSAGASYNRISATGGGPQTNGNDLSSTLVAGTLESLQFSFPLYEQELGVGLSFQPYTQSNFRLESRDTLSLSASDNPVPLRRNLRGEGGLSRFRSGLGYRINDMLSVGASADFLFGIVQSERSTSFGRSSSLSDVAVSDETRLFGITSTLGIHLTLADVLREDDALSIGGAATLPTTLDGTRVLAEGQGQNTSRDTLESVEGEISIPWQGRLGVAYQPNQSWTFTIDGLYEPWSNLSSNFDNRDSFDRSFPEGGERRLTDRWRLSVGTEVLPGVNDPLSGFLANIAYRLGFFTERLYVRPDGRTNLHTYALTWGFSLPTSVSGTRIDLNFRAGRRGTTDNGLVQDDFFGVSLHVNFGERWFQERKFR